MWEVEQKFRLTDASAVAVRLGSLGAIPGAAEEQRDRYFNHPARDFAVTDEALRIRQVGDANYLTYKGPKIDATTKTRREIEVPFAPGAEAATALAAALELLGFRPVATVAKRRQPQELSWQGFTVHVAVDDVAGLGQFLELEIAADDASLPAARAALASLADSLNLGSSVRESYLQLLLNVNESPQEIMRK